MSGTTISINQLIIDHWKVFSPDEQKQIEQRVHDLVLLSLTQALEGAVTPQVTPIVFEKPLAGVITAAPLPGALVGAQRISAADVPFGDASNYQDYTYDDFATLAEAHGVPPVAAIGHWFGKSLGIKFDESTPEIRRKVYDEMKAVYETAQGPDPIAPSGVGRPPMAVQAAPYVQPNLQVCPQCGQEAKFVNGGISKRTGKPYTGFWSCNKQPQCTTLYNGTSKGQTWTVDRDWTAAYNRAHTA
jgi:hypothetical protein